MSAVDAMMQLAADICYEVQQTDKCVKQLWDSTPLLELFAEGSVCFTFHSHWEMRFIRAGSFRVESLMSQRCSTCHLQPAHSIATEPAHCHGAVSNLELIPGIALVP